MDSLVVGRVVVSMEEPDRVIPYRRPLQHLHHCLPRPRLPPLGTMPPRKPDIEPGNAIKDYNDRIKEATERRLNS